MYVYAGEIIHLYAVIYRSLNSRHIRITTNNAPK